jgi:hypothetical protein
VIHAAVERRALSVSASMCAFMNAALGSSQPTSSFLRGVSLRGRGGPNEATRRARRGLAQHRQSRSVDLNVRASFGFASF